MKALLLLCLVALAVCATTNQTHQKKMAMVKQSIKALEAKKTVHKPVTAALKLLKTSFKTQNVEGIQQAKTQMQDYYSGCTQVGGNLCGGRPQLRDLNRLIELLTAMLDMDASTTRTRSSSSRYAWEWETSEKGSSSERWSEVRSENDHSSRDDDDEPRTPPGQGEPVIIIPPLPYPHPKPPMVTPMDCYYAEKVYCPANKRCMESCENCAELAVADLHGICTEYCPDTTYACAKTGRCVTNCQDDCDDHSRADWYEMRCIPIDTTQLNWCFLYGTFQCFEEGIGGEQGACVPNCHEYCGYTNGIDAYNGNKCAFEPNPGACMYYMHQSFCPSTHKCVPDCMKCPGLHYAEGYLEVCGKANPATCAKEGKVACPHYSYGGYEWECVEDCEGGCEGKPVENYAAMVDVAPEPHRYCYECPYDKYLCPEDNTCKSSCQNCVGYRHEDHYYDHYGGHRAKCMGCQRGYYCPVKDEFVMDCCKECGKGFVKQNQESCSCDAGWDAIERLTKRVEDEFISNPSSSDFVYSDYGHFIGWVESVISGYNDPDILPRCDVTVLPWKNPDPDNWLSHFDVSSWNKEEKLFVLKNHFIKGRYTFEELAHAEEVETFATEFEDHPQTYRVINDEESFFLATPNAKRYISSNEDVDDRFAAIQTHSTSPWGGHNCFADGNGIIHGVEHAVVPEYCWEPSASKEENWAWDHPMQPEPVCKVMDRPCDDRSPGSDNSHWVCPVGYCKSGTSPFSSAQWPACEMCDVADDGSPQYWCQSKGSCYTDCKAGCGGNYKGNSLTGRCEPAADEDQACGSRHWCYPHDKCVDDCYWECDGQTVNDNSDDGACTGFPST